MDPAWASGWYRHFAPFFRTILIHSLAPYENDENRRMIENIGYVKVSRVSASLHFLTRDDIFWCSREDLSESERAQVCGELGRQDAPDDSELGDEDSEVHTSKNATVASMEAPPALVMQLLPFQRECLC